MTRIKIKRVNLWLGEPFFEKIKERAEKEGLSVGSYVRMIVMQTFVHNSNSKNTAEDGN